jgi:hypothetical protein
MEKQQSKINLKTSSYESMLKEFMPKNPLIERRDYSIKGRDILEQNAVELLDKGIKLPIELELQLRRKYEKI